MSALDEFKQVYSKPGALWTRRELPKIVLDVLGERAPKPGSSLDIACGEGFYSIELSKRNFRTIGIDFSEDAIRYARQNAAEANSQVDFRVMDVKNLKKLGAKFDFLLEWGLLHHLTDEEVEEYTPKVPSVKNSTGKYLSVSFDISSPIYGSPGQKVRRTSIGTTLYYRSAEELIKIFNPYFKIIRTESVDLIGRSPATGKDIAHPGNAFLLEKKD